MEGNNCIACLSTHFRTLFPPPPLPHLLKQQQQQKKDVRNGFSSVFSGQITVFITEDLMISEHSARRVTLSNCYESVKGATSRFVHLEKITLSSSSASTVLRVNHLHSQPLLFPCALL